MATMPNGKKVPLAKIRANNMYTFLVAHKGQGYTMAQLCKKLGIKDGVTTRRAMQLVRERAEREGLICPVAVPATGWVYMITDDPRDVLDPRLHLTAIRMGVARTERKHAEFIADRKSRLTKNERVLTESLDKFSEAVNVLNDEAGKVVAATIASRRDARKAAENGAS